MSEPNRNEDRKAAHVRICSTRDVACKYNFWDDVQLVHSAMPEIDLDEIDTEVRLFGKKLSAPIMIAAMTGGFDTGEKINASLAKAAAELQIGMGVGSQRSAVEDPGLARTYAVVKQYDVPLIVANIGAPQLLLAGNYRRACEMVSDAISMIDADLIAVHLNYLQEAVQIEGQLRAKGLMALIRDLSADFPVIVKETGAGLAPGVVQSLAKTKVKGVDVGGTGGTSFSAVEFYRAQEEENNELARLGKTFWNWGIPAPVSAAVAALHLPTIATGGVRNGLDVARAIAIDASCAGIANKLLVPAMAGADAVKEELNAIFQELRIAMMLTGSHDVKALATHNPLVTGPTKEWLDHLIGE
jgi:isopentenyl-diphosphate delta-isomerase